MCAKVRRCEWNKSGSLNEAKQQPAQCRSVEKQDPGGKAQVSWGAKAQGNLECHFDDTR